MITPELEKMVWRGEADVNYISLAWGMFGRIPLHNGRTSIITQITWWNFLSPPNNTVTGTPYRDLFKYPEYTLKIESKKGVTQLPYRNSIVYTSVAAGLAQSGNVVVNTLTSSFNLQCGPPVIRQTYIVLEDFAKVTIFRNCMPCTAASMSVPASAANEKPSPEGIANIAVPARWTETSVGGNSEQYLPSSEAFGGVAPTVPKARFPYTQGIYPRIAGAGNSLESELDETNLLGLPFIQNPLVTFEVVSVNARIGDKLQTHG